MEISIGQHDEHRNFGELAWRPTVLYPDKVAIRQGERALTYSQLEERTQRVAQVLARLGVAKGNRVMLLLPNDHRFPECLLGTARGGGVAVPANIRLGNDTLGYIAEHSEATVLIAHADLEDRIAPIRSMAPNLRHVLVAGGDLSRADSYDALLDETEPHFATVPVDVRDDVAIQLYTSGSTGRPKGVLLTHAAEWWQARSSARVFLFDERDTALVMGPLYHANALWLCLLPMLFTGGTVVMLPGFDTELVLTAIDRDRPTYTSGTPSMFSLLLGELGRNAGRYDVSSISFLLCGSAPVPDELMRAIRAGFRCEVSEVYGLSEGGTNVQTPRWGLKKVGSCGLPMPDVEIRVADLDHPERDCPPGVVGELWSRCPANSIGYFREPELTAERFTLDGWLKTGDLMRTDEQGYVYFCGRKDDMISVGGENVYPKEVETILLGHPGIADACVVPAPHRVKGQAPVAWVVLRTSDSMDEEAVKRYFLARGPAYAHPRRVFFVDRLPLSGTNKLDRRALEVETRRLLPEPLGGDNQ